jgi:prepilin-type N-terminal cleavage/methylation domain-containing protein
MRRGRGRGRTGFTLVEIMIVVVLIGMLCGIVYASWQYAIPRANLNAAVRELSAVLQQSRSEAISRGAEFKIEYYFEPGNGHPRGYRVITPFAAGGAGGVALQGEERLALEWKRLPEDVEFKRITINSVDFDKGSCEVTFDGRGSCSDHVVVLSQHIGDDEALYTIEVRALTGDIQMHDGEFRREAPNDGDFK